ncbi:MAG: Y-family DNA polymerase, partial [Oscillospiraceae bacterium]|nr:Y-family DNA polymerase [Oscillospiraceae bacterium]
KIRDIVEKNHVHVFSGNFALYGDMSRRVQEVLRNYSPSIEVYSIDEAFLDLDGMDVDFDKYAKEISRECWRQTSIPVSVGIAPTKTLAKIASKLCKRYPKLKGGCYMHRPQDIEKVLRNFPAEDIWGIGRRMMRRLEAMGVQTAWDYASLPETTVRMLFHLPGYRTWKELKGIPCIALEDMIEPRKTICVSRSFSKEITSLQELGEQVANFAESAVTKLRSQHSIALEMVVFAMTNRFRQDAPQAYASKYVVIPDGTADHRIFIRHALEGCRDLFREGYGYKKAGVVITKLVQEEGFAHSLFSDMDALGKESRLSESIDSIHKAFGRGAVLLGSQGSGEIRISREHQSPHYTTLWSDLPKSSVR